MRFNSCSDEQGCFCQLKKSLTKNVIKAVRIKIFNLDNRPSLDLEEFLHNSRKAAIWKIFFKSRTAECDRSKGMLSAFNCLHNEGRGHCVQ